MLDYKKNRIDYGQQLSPPEGYKLDYAVATTYSLDLHALMAIPVALFYAKNLDGKPSETRMDILDAIQKTGDRVKVYCQKGKIQTPDTHNRIVSFIDDCVAEVLPTEEHASFHPKVWVLRFSSKGKPTVYRFFILSRNLTFDRSWDLAFFMEGYVSGKEQEKNRPLRDFVAYLNGMHKFPNAEKFMAELMQVEFQHEFDDVSFLPLGIPGYYGPLPMDFGRMLIISPFVQKDALDYIRSASTGKRLLFSRREELTKLPKGTLKGFKPYFISQFIVEGEDAREEGSEDEPKLQNLHAKLFIGQKYNSETNKKDKTWYLGSANCSMAAMQRNQEFMIKLATTDNRFGVGNIKNILLGEEENFFEEHKEPEEEMETDETDLSLEFRRITYHLGKFLDEMGMAGKCILFDPEKKQYNLVYTLMKTIPSQLSGWEIAFSAYNRDLYIDLRDEQTTYTLDGIKLENLSPFLKWRLTHKLSGESRYFLTKMDVELPKERKDAIFRSIIENKEKFFQFLQFLLGREGVHNDLSNSVQKLISGEGGAQIWEQDTPLLEELFLTVSREPERIAEIDKIVEKLDSVEEGSPVPKEFKEFWSVFKPFAKHA